MNWAHHAILALQAGRQATITPRGHSMRGRVNDGDTVILSPVPTDPCPACGPSGRSAGVEEPAECPACAGRGSVPRLAVDDIVLVKVKGTVYLHLIKAVQDRRYQIGNNRGGINGWVGRDAIYGLAVSVAGPPVRPGASRR
jgi:hypothetical protein